MENIYSALRATLIIALFVIGTLFLFGEENDATVSAFLTHFILDKSIGAACFYGVYRLIKKWD
jgi:hypothetical protein